MKSPRIEAIYLATRAGAGMVRVAGAEAVAGLGLAADRYLLGTGFFSPRNVCEVTFIEAEALERMEKLFGVEVAHGQHRRNIVTRDVAHAELRGRRFRVGAVTFDYDRPRPPCGYLERITEPRMTRAMGEGPGFCARVITDGNIREGDGIVVTTEAPERPLRHLP